MATFPLGTALHFFAARGKQDMVSWPQMSADGPEENDARDVIECIHGVFRTDARAKSTADFLRSMALNPAPQSLKSDVKRAGESDRMNRE